MEQEPDKLRDPVCGMLVPHDKYAVEYLGLHFAFCSQQCQIRFLANPHLYIGQPGHKPQKSQAGEIIKQRSLRLAEPLPPEKAEVLIAGLCSMMGVKNVVVAHDRIEITYDLLQATAEQIENGIREIGGRLGQGWAEKIHRAFVHYLEETEVDSLEGHSSSHDHHH